LRYWGSFGIVTIFAPTLPARWPIRECLPLKSSLLRFVSCVVITSYSATAAANAKLTPNADLSLERKINIKEQETGKWLPVPIPVSNPTVGAGLQAALLYLHPKKAGDDSETPSATSGLGGMYTNTDSKVIGVFHDNYFANDKYRLKLVAGVGDLNLDFYGVGDSTVGSSFSYNIKPMITFAQFMVRVPYMESSYIGIKHLYSDAEVEFQFNIDLPPEYLGLEVPALKFESITSTLGLVYTYDSRNDGFYPSEGINSSLSYNSDDEAWGSGYKFQRLTGSYKQYFSLTETQTLAIKGAISDVDGDPPFYMLSTLQMRGFATGRYLDNTSASLHAEWRYKFAERWGVNVFAESGKIGDSLDHLINSNAVDSFGLGLRWQPIASKKLNLGVDVAQSSDDSAVYLRVGEAF